MTGGASCQGAQPCLIISLPGRPAKRARAAKGDFVALLLVACGLWLIQSIMLPHGFTHGFVAQATQKTFVGMEPQPCCHMSNFRQVRHRGFSQESQYMMEGTFSQIRQISVPSVMRMSILPAVRIKHNRNR